MSTMPFSNTCRVGDLLDWMTSEGLLVEEVPAGRYDLQIASVEVFEDALRPTYKVLTGRRAGATFRGTKFNLTPKGVRRFAQSCRAWGVIPGALDDLQRIAVALTGKKANAEVEVREFKGYMLHDINLRGMRRLAA